MTPGLTASPLDWITIEKASNVIKITIPANAFQLYHQQTLWVGIKATMKNAPKKYRYDKSFSIYFESMEIAYCSISTFIAPLKAPSGLSTRVYEVKPTEFSLDKISDTGS